MAFSWVSGRQNSGYSKCKLFESQRFKCDMYLLKFEKGAGIPQHTDPVQNGRHFRLNIVLKSAGKGGQFVCAKTIFQLANRIYFFRPDEQPHSVTKIENGCRYVLSIGWLN